MRAILEKQVIETYDQIIRVNTEISVEVLDFMKDAALERINNSSPNYGALPKAILINMIKGTCVEDHYGKEMVSENGVYKDNKWVWNQQSLEAKSEIYLAVLYKLLTVE